MFNNQEGTSYRLQIRILAVYCLLILLSFSGAVLAIRRVLLYRLDARIDQAINQEIKELQVLVNGKDPETAQPFGDDITAIFDVFLKRNIPINDEYTIALLPDRFYASVPIKLPPVIAADSAIAERWKKLTESKSGEIGNSENRIVYSAEPIEINGKIKGVFVIAIATKSELQQVNEAVSIVIRITAVTILVTSVLAWIFAGKVLIPLRLLTETARTISENNFDERIVVQGNDEVAQLSKTFNEMLDRLQRAFVVQQQFLNDVGHELRTPITIAQGHLELMGDSPQEQQETKDIVLDELDRMNRLIADLMLLARSEQPNFLHLDPINLQTLTVEIYNKALAIADRNWELEAVGTAKIIGDRQRLIQAITNLAQNATKHTRPEDTIAIGSAIEGKYVSLWVRDTGTGIVEADKRRIFQRFQTGGNCLAAKSTGLGLSIVSAIVQAHDGRIELSSHLNSGSTFTVILPLG